MAASFTFAVLAIAALAYLYIQRREGPNTAGRVKSLVVLPFINASPNADAEYLSDGIADGLINSLSQIPELRVIARTTAFRFKGKEADFQRLGRELSVDAVLTGRLQQVGDTLVIQADLVSLGTGSELWGDRYNRKLTDVLSVQEEITHAISQKLRPRLTADEQRPLKKHYSDNPEAYQLYLRGRYFWNKRNEEGLTRAIDYFQKAIELEPSFALAYAGLADSYTLQAFYGFTKDGYAKGETAARKALALDDELAEAHATLAFIAGVRWDWVNAEKGFKRAIALNPNYATAHHWYGNYLRFIAHREEALAELKRAQQLDPLSKAITNGLGMALYDMGLNDGAIAAFKDALEMSPGDAVPNAWLALCYVKKNMYQEAISRSREALALSNKKAPYEAALATIYALTGNRDDALTILNELKTREAEDLEGPIAQVYVALNDKESAFKWLEIAYQRRSKELFWLKGSAYEPLRADPRYADLVRRIGFPE
jgi:TolB-like protein/Tfp pilus assembly protein PilF